MEENRKKVRHTGAMITVIVLFLLTALLAVTCLIAQVWIPKERDTYEYPVAEKAGHIEIRAGDKYSFESLERENEEIKSIEVLDPDILSVSGKSVYAKGEYFETVVRVTTGEKYVPEEEPYYKGIEILGKDISGLLNSLRKDLRVFYCIEKPEEPRTELRNLNIFDYTVTVSGFASPSYEYDYGQIMHDSTMEIEVELAEGEEIISIETDGGNHVEILEETDEEGKVRYLIAPLEGGDTEIVVKTGYPKAVDRYTYNRNILYKLNS